MKTSFETWLKEHKDPAHVLFYLFEVSTEFPKGEINSLFRQQLDRRASQLGISENQLIQMHEFDWVGYIARSLRNAGFSDDQIDPHTQDIVVRLLVKPGKLFSAWNADSPIMARFKTSVRNAVINLAQKRQTRRRNIPSRSIHRDAQRAMGIPATHSQSESLIQAFRESLLEKHGQAALDVFDERLSGGETKSLVGQPGLETSYKIKKVVQTIKRTAEEFGASDPEFLALVRRAMEDEAETVEKRFGVKAS